MAKIILTPQAFDEWTRAHYARLPNTDEQHRDFKANRALIVEMRAEFGFDPIEPTVGKPRSARRKPVSPKGAT